VTIVAVFPGNDQLLCDFCSHPHPTWKYPARDFETPPVGTSVGSWYACEECRALIERKDRLGLTERSVRRFIERYGFGNEAELLVDLGTIHTKFFDHRTGEAARLWDM